MITIFHVKGPEASTSSLIRFGTVLPDGVTYSAILEWLRYEGYWILTWGTDAGVKILAGVRVVSNFNMFYPYSDPRLPNGSLICHDTQNLRQPPGRHDWRERHILTFSPRTVLPDVDVVSATVIAA